MKTGLSYLPMVVMILAASGIGAQFVSRVGARPLMIAGAATGVGGLFWMSRLTEHSTYVGGLLGPLMIAGFGMGLISAPTR